MVSSDALVAAYGLSALLFAAGAMFLGGFTKGAVGFALPMVAVSGMGAVLPAEVAVAGLLLPALLTNVWQSFRDGIAAAAQTFRKFRRYTLAIIAIMGLVAPLVRILPSHILLTILGVGVSTFALLQLLGWRLTPAQAARPRTEAVSALIAGVFGGLAAVTGPAVVLYLLARNVPKAEQMRIQGIIFGLGLLVLLAVHGTTGVANALTLTLSAGLILPGLLGMAVGLWVNDKLDQALFQKLTLVVLILAGLNLLRRGLAGA